MNISISDLKKDGLQLREAISEDVVAEYAEAMHAGAQFPPVTVFRDPGTGVFYLADGFHRVEAAQRAGRSSVEADVRTGDYWAAEAYACGANASAPRSPETKRRCVTRLWENRMRHFGKNDPSEREIANLAHVSRSYVHNVISALATSGQCVLPPTVTGRNGVTRTRPEPPTRRASTPPSPPRTRPAREGYYIGEDGREHADGVELDRFDAEIPARLADAFKDGAEQVGDWANRVNAVKLDINAELKSGFPVAIAQRVTVELENAYHELKAALPFCVCRMCQGQGCTACSSTGYQTRDQYNRNPPEFKA